jgi:hypothetical protein
MNKLKYIAQEGLAKPKEVKIISNKFKNAIIIGVGTLYPSEAEFEHCTFHVLTGGRENMDRMMKDHKTTLCRIVYDDEKRLTQEEFAEVFHNQQPRQLRL